ncbi:MAG: hypothetical protein QHH18_03505 [Candidatus Bathyarchaeota archaeon]|jgi:hypothetical protein|nr:hypothetical protein [Candidatus Bathyarchaeota archaeon]
MTLPIARIQNFLSNVPDNGKIRETKRKLNIAKVKADSALMHEEKKNRQETIALAKIPKTT